MKSLLLVALGFGIVSCGHTQSNPPAVPTHTDTINETAVTPEAEISNTEPNTSIIYRLASIQCLAKDSNGVYNERTVLAAPSYVEFIAFKENKITFSNFSGSCSYTKQANMTISDSTPDIKSLNLTDITITPTTEDCSYEKNVIKFDAKENVTSEDIIPTSDAIKSGKIDDSLIYFSSADNSSMLIFSNDFKVQNRPEDVCINVYVLAN